MIHIPKCISIGKYIEIKPSLSSWNYAFPSTLRSLHTAAPAGSSFQTGLPVPCFSPLCKQGNQARMFLRSRSQLLEWLSFQFHENAKLSLYRKMATCYKKGNFKASTPSHTINTVLYFTHWKGCSFLVYAVTSLPFLASLAMAKAFKML